MQSIGGLINDLLVFVGFLFLSLFVSGKIKLGEENKNKLNTIINRKRSLFKILAYAGTIIFAIIILLKLFSRNNHKTEIVGQTTQMQVSTEWTLVEKSEMVRGCIGGAKKLFQKDSNMAKAICACAMEDYTSRYTKHQYEELSKKGKQEQIDFYKPLIKACFNEIDSTK